MNFDPSSISRFKKIKYLIGLTEDDFRDKLVRTLFLRQGLKDGRDVCGVDEKGKDAIFWDTDKLGLKNLYAVQTKKGKINLSSKLQENLLQALTQVRTALETPIPLVQEKTKALPSKVILCASGSINEKAREHITESIKDPRIVFMDAEELIPAIDANYPEFWLGINTEMVPYFQGIRRWVESGTQDQLIAEIGPSGSMSDPAADASFVMLNIHRVVVKTKKEHGKFIQTPEFEEFNIPKVLDFPERNILIRGDAGAGKTTALRRLAYILAGQALQTSTGFRIPVIVRAHDLADQKDLNYATTLETMLEGANRVTKLNAPCFSAEDLEEGRVVLLVDGLDEIADTVAKKKAIAALLELSKQYSKNQIILTTRDNLSSRGLPETATFAEFILSPISFKQADKIIRRFQKGRALNSEKSTEVLRRLQDVHGMDLNPLLVTVFAATSDYSRKDVPANITELFKKYTEMMLGRWNASKTVGQQFHAPLKDFLLCTIAFEMHKSKQTSISVTDFKSRISEELTKRGHAADIEKLESELLLHSGLMRIFDDRVEFRHFLLQEFFAGRGIPSRDSIRYLITNDWWVRPLVFFFGQNPGESDIFLSIQNSLSNCSADELFCAALITGLALQACYLVELDQKVKIFPWTVEKFVESQGAFMATFDAHKKYPLSRFIHYYLMGRDSVACAFICEKLPQIKSALLDNCPNPATAELRHFWIIVGLIEAGCLAEASKELETFNPKNGALYLPIHLGCYLILQIRVTSKEEKEIAENIVKRLAGRTAALRNILKQEWKSEMLEIRNGRIEELTNTSEP